MSSIIGYDNKKPSAIFGLAKGGKLKGIGYSRDQKVDEITCDYYNSYKTFD